MHQASNPGILGNIWGEVEKVEKRLNWLLFYMGRNMTVYGTRQLVRSGTLSNTAVL